MTSLTGQPPSLPKASCITKCFLWFEFEKSGVRCDALPDQSGFLNYPVFHFFPRGGIDISLSTRDSNIILVYLVPQLSLISFFPQSKAAYVLFYQRQDKICHPLHPVASASSVESGEQEDSEDYCESLPIEQAASRDFMDVD